MGLLISDQVPPYETFGTNSLIVFRKACIESIQDDPGHAIFYRLLADHVERLIDAYHQVPLESSVVKRDFEHFQALVAIATRAFDQPADLQMQAVNSMAAAEFF